MKRISVVLFTLALMTFACTWATPTAPPSEASPTPAVEAATPTAVPGNLSPVPATPENGIPVTSPGFSMVVPTGLATGAHTEDVPAFGGTDVPSWEIHPAYSQTTLQDYPLKGRFFEPQIFIFPAGEFAQMSDGAAQAITDLKAVLASPSATPDHMPFLPNFNASQVFYSNSRVLQFQGGTGIRYLTQYDQGFMPINNQELFYTFQGLTQDEKYYVAAILPVNASFLSAEGSPNSPVPPDGIPFDWNNPESMAVYLESIKERLGSTDPNAFTPTLPTLDVLVQSLSVSSP